MYRASAAYFGVVLVGYGVDFSLFSVLVLFGSGVVLANTVAFLVGSVVNAVLVRRFVFRNHRFQAGTDLVLTLLVNVAFFGIGTLLLSWLVASLGANPYGAKILVNGATFAGNFATRAIFFRAA